jgi:hypothetical protein
MINVQEATRAAMTFAQNVLERPRNDQLLLEEVELGMVDGKEVWFITLSHPKPILTLEDGLAHVSGSRLRDYKTFTIDADTGSVISMKIRQLAHASDD